MSALPVRAHEPPAPCPYPYPGLAQPLASLNASTTTTVTWALPPTKGHGLIIWLAVGMTGSPEKTGTLVIRHVTAVFEAWPD